MRDLSESVRVPRERVPTTTAPAVSAPGPQPPDRQHTSSKRRVARHPRTTTPTASQPLRVIETAGQCGHRVLLCRCTPPARTIVCTERAHLRLLSCSMGPKGTRSFCCAQRVPFGKAVGLCWRQHSRAQRARNMPPAEMGAEVFSLRGCANGSAEGVGANPGTAAAPPTVLFDWWWPVRAPLSALSRSPADRAP